MYDPKQAYFDRMTPARRVRLERIRGHQFTNSIGGCSSNYHD
nr:hypothetical protein [Sulfurimonas sp. SAG-AH-194-C21]